MKLSSSFLTASLCCTAAAVRPHVSPDTARLIIAQRLGLSRFHSIEHAEPETIRHINAYGGRRPSLFGAGARESSKAHLLVWIDDAERAEATVIINDGSELTQDFVITSPPSTSDNERLIEDLILQAKSLPPYPDPQKRTYTSGFEIETLLNDLIPSDKKPALYNDYLHVFRASKADELDGERTELALATINEKADKLGFSTTIVMIPASKAHAKRNTHPWGPYNLPSRDVGRQNFEAQLSITPGPSSSPNPGLADHDDFPVASLAQDDSPVRGILPSCFDTMVACEKQTHNCSNHGECKLLHKGRGTGSNQESVDCFGCACVPTVQHVDEDKGMESKRKVTYWGGPACQKKDISIQFWLFVGTGVILAFLVSSGIGMLYSMGSEELPSVIGAGVSGPVRK